MNPLAFLLRRPAREPRTPAEVEAARLVRARRVGPDALAEHVADLAFRCRLAGINGGLGGIEHRDAVLAALREMDALAWREVVALLKRGEGEMRP